jgi:hypothetical protein
MAALFANTLVYQKLINKYDDNPTPSHPINICTKFSDEISSNIKNVNNDKKAKYLLKDISYLIYSNEYICTKKEINKTTTNITEVITSKKKLISIVKYPRSIHLYSLIKQIELLKLTSKNITKLHNKHTNKQLIIIKMTPFLPIILPNNNEKIHAINGKNKINKYINFFLRSWYIIFCTNKYINNINRKI